MQHEAPVFMQHRCCCCRRKREKKPKVVRLKNGKRTRIQTQGKKAKVAIPGRQAVIHTQ